MTVPDALAAEPPVRQVVRADHAQVIAPMASAAHAAVAALAARGIHAQLIEAPVSGDVERVAQLIATEADARLIEARASGAIERVGAEAGARAIVLWGEPTVTVPHVHGAGGRSQQLALLLARWLRGTSRVAFVVGTDGIDGPPPPGRPSPAGAWVGGTTWDAVAAAGIDPAAALAGCDAGTALAAIGALVVTGPTGINHADLIVVS